MVCGAMQVMARSVPNPVFMSRHRVISLVVLSVLLVPAAGRAETFDDATMKAQVERDPLGLGSATSTAEASRAGQMRLSLNVDERSPLGTPAVPEVGPAPGTTWGRLDAHVDRIVRVVPGEYDLRGHVSVVDAAAGRALAGPPAAPFVHSVAAEARFCFVTFFLPDGADYAIGICGIRYLACADSFECEKPEELTTSQRITVDRSGSIILRASLTVRAAAVGEGTAHASAEVHVTHLSVTGPL